MDSFTWAFSGCENVGETDYEFASALVDPNVVDGNQLEDHSLEYDLDLNLPRTSNVPGPEIHSTDLSKRLDGDSADHSNFCDAVLMYINQALMEDDLEDEARAVQDSSTLHAAEQCIFYELLALTKKDPSSPNQPLPHDAAKSSLDVSISECCSNFVSSSSFINANIISDLHESKYSSLLRKSYTHHDYHSLQTNSQSVCSPSGQSSWTFNGEGDGKGNCMPEKDDGDFPESLRSRRRRKSLPGEEGNYCFGKRDSKKHLAAAPEEEDSILHEIFDKVLSLYDNTNEDAPLSSDKGALPLPSEANEGSKRNGLGKGFSNHEEAARNKKGAAKRKAIDMRSLLIQCMQSVAGNDHRSASKLLRQIRLHSSILSVMDPKDQVIVEVAENATRLHIIHLGVSSGLQWPPLIQRLSTRKGGPPKLRITGIDLPHSGLRNKGTGRRLANYCETFGVPFEYNAIETQWETLSVADLRIEDDEVLVVNCFYLLMFLPDDTVMKPSPRDTVLNLIESISPDISIHGISNGTYNSPFFDSRFREALFHYSAMFDMFEANVSRESQERMVYERDIMGNEILSITASEGVERVLRPETYRRWQIRTLRAGFRQLPLDQDTMRELRAKVKSRYHKDFFVDEASQWMLAGWKGRTLFAFSCWRPA